MVLPSIANPWVILGAVVALGISHGYVGKKGYDWGSTYEKNQCNTRVAALQKQIADANEAIRKVGEQWKAAFDNVVDSNSKLAAADQEKIDQLTKKAEDYEQRIANDKSREHCVVTPDDANSLR
jgi:hypothetical protein